MAEIDFQLVRKRFPLVDYAQKIGIRLRRSGNLLVGKCPIHQEQKGEAFSVDPRTQRWRCWGKCNRGGDVVDLEQLLNGGATSEAVERLVGSGTCPRLAPPQSECCNAKYILNAGDVNRMTRASHNLAAHGDAVHRLAAGRPEWTAEALGGIALDGDLGLEGTMMLFGYRHGIKARWNDEAGNRIIRWLCGHAFGECWRQSLLLRSHRTVYLAEGETDALTLVSLGLEEPGKSLVLALPSASILPDPEPFRDREIIVVPDPDAAGEAAATSLRERLSSVAASVVVIALPGVCYGPR